MRSALTTARYAALPVGVALSSSPVTTFLQRTLHNVCADDKIHVEHLTGCERDAQLARNDRVRLHITCSEADARTRGHTGETMEHRVVVCAKQRDGFGSMACRSHAAHALCVGASACIQRTCRCHKDNHGELDGMYTEGGAQAPAEKKPRRVGRDIDTRTNFTQLACRLKQYDAVPNMSAYGLRRGYRCLRQLR